MNANENLMNPKPNRLLEEFFIAWRRIYKETDHVS
ncbi:unnamed protein product [Nezara viridula]|uniref:Uncharacterized protein n=1 Tax=Nezara viridula TaxID=85310 RepID=A0A9P0E8F0_NEZVI|nr:unnamed protein product [Nezara viridula]CAH1393536.1 unnamed protein product [Nezara viridula]